MARRHKSKFHPVCQRSWDTEGKYDREDAIHTEYLCFLGLKHVFTSTSRVVVSAMFSSPLLSGRQRAACHDIAFLPLMSLGWSAASFADCDDAVPAKLRMTPAVTEPLFKKIVSCLCRGTLPALILSRDVLDGGTEKGERRERCPLSDDRKETEIYQESDAKIKTSQRLDRCPK